MASFGEKLRNQRNKKGKGSTSQNNQKGKGHESGKEKSNARKGERGNLARASFMTGRIEVVRHGGIESGRGEGSRAWIAPALSANQNGRKW